MKIIPKRNKILDQENKRRLQIEVTVLIGIILLFLMIFFVLRAYIHYTELESHRRYLMQSNASIQDWMTINLIVRQYYLTESEIYKELNVSPGAFVEELGVDNSILVDRMTIKTICVKKHLDCNTVVNRLNSIRTK